MKILSIIGQHSGLFLILGMVFAAILPGVSSALRPALPYLVALILSFGFVQFNFKKAFLELLKPRNFLLTICIILVGNITTALLMVAVSAAFNITESWLLLLIVFAASPPLSSSISLSIILRFNAHVTLQTTLLSMLVIPIIGPLCFAIAGFGFNFDPMLMGLQIAGMILGGLSLAFIMQLALGERLIANHKDEFSGLSILILIIFLFPLFDGVAAHIKTAPLQALSLLLMALVLNLGSHFFLRWHLLKFTNKATADAYAFMFGNRNISIYLAVLPFNPMLSVFVAAAQIPIYITPAILNRKANAS